MKLIQLLIVAASLFCTAVFAAGPTWNPIPITPPTGNYYQQPTAPDYAGNVSRGFSQMGDALRQYERTRPEPQRDRAISERPSRVLFPDGTRGVYVDANTMFITHPNGAQAICGVVNQRLNNCKAR